MATYPAEVNERHNVKIAAKVNLTGFDVQSLYFYSYDAESNSYRRIDNTNYFIDKNGYLHFNTTSGGTIIISNGPLERK